ncbi:MAG: DnaJ domain-containing protein [Bryobacterales bacterium]|nr:DnaJ domain-containing protein [Bryobacterales bacterium]
MQIEDPEAILGVEANATDEEIRAAYLACIAQFPPDRAPTEFERIRDAYELMRDPRARARRVLFGRGLDWPLEKLLGDTQSARTYAGPEPWLEALKASAAARHRSGG